MFSSLQLLYILLAYFHGNNHKLDALFSYIRTRLNRPAESYFTRKFSNHFVVMDIGLWHIRSSFCLVKHFKSSFSLLSFSFWPSGNYRFYTFLRLVVNKARLIWIAYFTHWHYVEKSTWLLFNNLILCCFKYWKTVILYNTKFLHNLFVYCSTIFLKGIFWWFRERKQTFG